MANKLFVVGLPYETTQEELTRLFSTCGKVANAKIISDRATGRSKGFGFVEMTTEAEAQAAIKKLHGSTLGHRQISVNEAQPAENRTRDFSDKPSFVERRSGIKDRPKSSGGFGGGDRPASFDKPRKWGDKPSFGGPKKWERKSGGFGGGDKREGFGGAKKWGDKPSFGGGDKRRSFGKPKKWEAKPSGFGSGDKREGFGGPKKWGDKPSFGGGDKRKSFGGAKKWGDKPRSFGGKPGSFSGRENETRKPRRD
jgi:RNA recognition motif-containing protein